MHDLGLGPGQVKGAFQDVLKPRRAADLGRGGKHERTPVTDLNLLQADHDEMPLLARAQAQDGGFVTGIDHQTAGRDADAFDIFRVHAHRRDVVTQRQAQDLRGRRVYRGNFAPTIQKKGRDFVERRNGGIQVILRAGLIQTIQKGTGALEMAGNRVVIQQARSGQVDPLAHRFQRGFPQVQKRLIPRRIKRHVIKTFNRFIAGSSCQTLFLA